MHIVLYDGFQYNNCILVNSGQIANPIIMMVDPVPYYSIHMYVYVCEYINCKHRKNLQFTVNRFSQSGLHLGGGGTRPPLRIATIYIHNIESSPQIDRKGCLNWMFLLILTCELSLASHSAQEGTHTPPAPTPWH